MSANGSITLTWGDGEHEFRLAIGQLLELQEKCDAGPAEIASRLHEGRWRINDVSETIRLGLIGGGKKPGEAFTLVKRYVHDRPWLENVMFAQAILMTALVGDPKDPVGKEQAAEDQAGSPPPSSTAQDAPLVSAPAKLMQ